MKSEKFTSQELDMISFPPVHKKPDSIQDFKRLDMLWNRYPQYHEKTVSTTLKELLEEHETYRDDFEELRDEYINNGYERFLIRLSWSDLPYRFETRSLIEEAGELAGNRYTEAFLGQFSGIDTDRKACFLFPESYVSQFFVVKDVCSRAEIFCPVSNLFPDESKVHYLAVFDKSDMNDVLLMFHLLYSNASEELFGGYSLYDYPFPWYQTHLSQGNTVLRSPYLPDRLAKYQGNIPFCLNPSKTVYVRRNITHILECGYFSSELEFFRNLTEIIMPYFQWWYQDLAMYEEKDGFHINWRLERTKIRTRLTAEGVINPKWKHELTLFRLVRKMYPDTLYQYRPDWLGRQSLDLFIPGINTAIEYQGIQHYDPVGFFGGDEALAKRKELDRIKRQLCEENNIRLIEWAYDIDPTEENVKKYISEVTRNETCEEGKNE